MAKERLKSPRARLFVALDLPEQVRGGLEQWQRRALGDPALRPVAAQALHITLCFLDYHPEKQIDRIAEIVTGVGARPVELRLDREATPLPGGRPRLYAVGAQSDAAVALQAELSGMLEKARFYVPEKREFWPHVTVARVRSERLPPRKGERRGKGRPRRVGKPPGPLPRPVTNACSAVRLRLYRSNLKPTGAEYVPLAGLDLPSAPSAAAKKGDNEDER